MLYGVLLAGGLSERFGKDKYLWRIQDRSLLLSIVASAVGGVSDKVLLLVRDQERASKLLKESPTHVDGFIIDDPNINCSRPPRGMLTALFQLHYSMLKLTSTS